jgi:hypothetical protein
MIGPRGDRIPIPSLERDSRLGVLPESALALQLLSLRASESMGNHDSNVVGAGRVG